MKYKYYYNDEPLIEYCKKHPEYKYNHLTKFISDKRKESPTRSVEEIINEYFSKPHKTYTRYVINGMKLSRACDVEKISYTAVTQDISKSKRDPRNSGMSEEEIVDMVLEKRFAGNTEELVFSESKKLVLKPNDKKSDN